MGRVRGLFSQSIASAPEQGCKAGDQDELVHPTRRLLNQCGWLSIRQLIFYHSAVAIFRTRESRLPVYLSQKLVTEHPYPTRLATGGGIRSEGIFGGLTSKSFLIRGPRDFNNIPADIRNCKTLPTFKQKLKIWVKTKIPVT